MTNPTDLQDMIGRTAVDHEGSKIGKVGQIYLDDQTGQPVWVTLHTGMFGTKESFAPLYGSRADGDNLVLAVSKDLVKDAPSVDADSNTSGEENDALYRHYEGHFGPAGPSRHHVAHRDDIGSRDNIGDERRLDLAGQSSGVQGRDTSGPTTDEAMTRSEERLHVGTETVETSRARLRKYIVTENVT